MSHWLAASPLRRTLSPEHSIDMQKLAFALRCLSLATFFSFVFVATYLGGEALNGKTEAGQYYLSWHGHLTQVSRAIFQYSYIHAMTALVLVPITMIVSFVSKPSTIELKWLNRVTGTLIALSAAYAYLRFRG